MLRRLLINCALLVVLVVAFFILSGCVYEKEPLPRITRDYGLMPKTVPPSSPIKVKFPGQLNENVPKSWLPPAALEKRWTAIVIHHSGTRTGNAAIFDKWHRQGRHWEGVGYDFVIGNGTNSTDGQVEVTYRWRYQKIGAHCKTPNNWANRNAVGICLVGNFNETSPTPRQMRSLLRLIRFLQEKYRIPKTRIYGHNNTPGARATDCPGKNFPLARLKSKLDF